uniref:Uncharacterized protein n=1 Tax=Aliivibrio fischeri TaxID=668 RepID=H2ES86_ALIFS|nr:hypothetical protein [Aliivibrio fischeri]
MIFVCNGLQFYCLVNRHESVINFQACLWVILVLFIYEKWHYVDLRRFNGCFEWLS